MTLVEFFDRTAADCVLSPLTMEPDRIILLGERFGMEAQAERMRRLLAARGRTPEILCRTVNRGDVGAITAALEEIVLSEEDVTLDLTGGEDLALFAAGQIRERYRDRPLQCHWFNVRTGQVKDCDLDGERIPYRQPALTVEELVALQGGRVIFEEEKPDTSHRWPGDEDFGRDIETMWAVCAADCALWNRQIGLLNELDRLRERDADPLVTRVDLARALPTLRSRGEDPDLSAVFAALADRGILTGYKAGPEEFRVRYKSEPVRQALGKAGTALELMTWHLARTLVWREQPVYTDCQTGVYIDWDGVLRPRNAPETDNEIDVILMKGMVPFFISCKNGTIDTEELYKVHTVAERFGGPYARKVLICTTWGSLTERKQASLKDRAREMGIYLLEGAHRFSTDQFRDALRKLDDWTVHVG